MNPALEQTMARGRAAGVTQRALRSVGRDGRTITLEPDGAEVVSFATCSTLALERDPRPVAAAIAAVQEHGVVFSASRCFATSPLYAEAEGLLAQVFGRPTVIVGSTTLAHGAALPILLDRSDVVLFDQQVHHSVQTALAALGARGPRCQPLPHSDLDALEGAIRLALGAGARRVWYAADGIYSMFGDRLPVAGLAALMGRYEALYAYLDDAHGMSWCGPNGSGSLLAAGLPAERTVVATSLSKGFGAGGGALVLPDQLTRERIENLGPSLMFSIQIPPAVLGAICANARIHLSDELPRLQAELAERRILARASLLADPALAPRLPSVSGEPTPIHYVALGEPDDAIAVTARLIEAGYLVNPVAYPAVPRGMSGVRFTVTRAHRVEDVCGLVAALGREVWRLEAVGRPAASVPGAAVALAG